MFRYPCLYFMGYGVPPAELEDRLRLVVLSTLKDFDEDQELAALYRATRPFSNKSQTCAAAMRWAAKKILGHGPSIEHGQRPPSGYLPDSELGEVTSTLLVKMEVGVKSVAEIESLKARDDVPDRYVRLYSGNVPPAYVEILGVGKDVRMFLKDDWPVNPDVEV